MMGPRFFLATLRRHCRCPHLIVGLSLVALTAVARAGTWYVAPDGSDDANGTLATPWKTVTHALEQAQPGDTIQLREGTYREQVTTVRDGTAGSSITLMNYPNEVPIVDGENSNWRNGIIIVHDYFNLVGVNVRNWEDTGIWMQPHADHLLVRGCVVYDCGAGIDIYEGVHDFVIDSVDLYGFREESHGLDMTSHDGTPIYNGLISNSKAHDGGGGNCDGFALGHRGDSNVYVSFGDIRDVTLVNCEVYNVGDGFDISGRNIRLERCVAHDTYYGGNYKLWGFNSTLVNCVGYNGGVNAELDHFIPDNPDDPPGTPPPSVEMYNCTFFNGMSYNISIETDSCRLKMYNCAILGGTNIGINLTALFVRGIYEGDYNLFGCGNPPRMFADPQIDVSLDGFADGRWTALSGQDTHSRVSYDPTLVFVDTSAASINLRPRFQSQLIDAGVRMDGRTPTHDFDGEPRDFLIDIGAFEYQHVDRAPMLGDAPDVVSLTGGPDGSVLWLDVSLAAPDDVRIEVRDLLGREVIGMDRRLEQGTHRIALSTGDLPSGPYFVLMNRHGAVASISVNLLR